MVAFPWRATFDLEDATVAVYVQAHVNDEIGIMALIQGRGLILSLVIC